MKRLLLFCSIVGLLAVPLGTPGQDHDRVRDRGTTPQHDLTPDQDRIRLQIRDELRTDGAVTEPALAALDPEIAAYARAGGAPEELREAARESVRSGCEGACLAEAIRAMNAVMARGESAPHARERIVAAVREEARVKSGASDAARGEKVRARVEGEEPERSRARALDRTRERTHAREPAAAGKGPR